MSQIEELERRIAAALDRIARGLEPEGAPGPGDSAALEAERAEMAEALQRLADALDTAQDEAARLRVTNDRLRATNRTLREANAAALADPKLVDSALEAELEALRAVRDADRAELDAILAALAPLARDREEAHA